MRQPTLATALCCEALFGVPLSELFGGMYDQAYEAVLVRARRLLADELQKPPGSAHARTRLFLEELLSKNPSPYKR